MNKGLLCAVALAGLGAMLSAPAQADILATDGFQSYSTGNLAGQTAGGTGIWAGGWNVSTSPNDYTNLVKVVDHHMTYTNGSLHIDGGSQAIELDADGGNGTTPLDRGFTAQTGTLYMSFLLQAPTVDVPEPPAPSPDDFFQFGFNNSFGNPNTSGGISGKPTPFFFSRVTSQAGNTTSGTTAVDPNTTYFLVLKISKSSPGEYNKVELFVNPDSDEEAAQTQTILASGGTGITTATDWVFRIARSETSDKYYFDHFTLGDSFASVVPVPEPATGALLLLALGGLCLIPRRRKA